MSQAAHDLGHEYWQPPVQGTVQDVRVDPQLCSRCNTEFIIGSRFCHVCGASREPQVVAEGGVSRFLDLQLIRDALGLSIGSLVSFAIAIVCVIAAVATGFIYTATTLLDWQAVQIWRIEWLLAATVAMLAGVLFKRSMP